MSLMRIHVFAINPSTVSISPIARGLEGALPIVFAYFPLAVTFGVISSGHGIPWYLTILISALVWEPKWGYAPTPAFPP